MRMIESIPLFAANIALLFRGFTASQNVNYCLPLSFRRRLFNTGFN